MVENNSAELRNAFLTWKDKYEPQEFDLDGSPTARLDWAGPSLRHVKEQETHFVWTELMEPDHQYLVNGFVQPGVADVLGYYVCANPWEGSARTLSVITQTSHLCCTCKGEGFIDEQGSDCTSCAGLGRVEENYDN
jgi:hypothetical protein